MASDPQPGERYKHRGIVGTVVCCDGVTVDVEFLGMTWTGTVEVFRELWEADNGE